MKNVKKAVIPAAGLGTRFLPATKSIPKEMLPIVDKPTLLYIIEEAVAAGIEDIVLVAGRGKSSIEDFFDVSYELEDTLEKKGQLEVLESLRKIRNSCQIISIRQKQALGLGHAVYTAHPIVGDEPFAVLLGDEITQSKSSQTVTGVLKSAYEKTGVSHVSIMAVPEADLSKYGIVTLVREVENSHFPCFELGEVIEKPSPGEAPSKYALPGRYVFTNDIFSALKNTKPGRNGEIQLTDAMSVVAKNSGMRGLEVPSVRFDAGDKVGFIAANIEFALQRPELRERLLPELKQLVERYQ